MEPEAPTPTNPPHAPRRHLFDYQHLTRRDRTMVLATMLLCSIVGYLLISHFVIGTVVVQGASMAPTLEAGQRFFVHRWFYLLQTPQRGDIVALRLPSEHAQLVKRVVALPLETICIDRGRVFVNGDALQEVYLHGKPTSGGPLGTNTYRIAADCYFVLGDNRANSSDSRSFGAVPRRHIVGLIRQ